MWNRRNAGLRLPDEVMAALTILAGRWGVSADEAAHRLLRDAIFLFDENLLPTDLPPIVKMAYSLLATAIDGGADELRLVPTPTEIEVWLRVDGHWNRVGMDFPLPAHVQPQLFDRYERMTGRCLARIVAESDARIRVQHNEKDYRVSVGYVADEAAVDGESLLLRIAGDAASKVAE